MLSDASQYILYIAWICPWRRTQFTPHSGASSSAGTVMQRYAMLCGMQWPGQNACERPGGSRAAAALSDGIGRQSLTCQCVAAQKGMGTTIRF